MAKEKEVAKKKKDGVCALGRTLIRAGKTNAQTLAAILKKYPESKLKIGGVGWLRSDMIKRGEKVKANASLKAA